MELWLRLEPKANEINRKNKNSTTNTIGDHYNKN